MYQTNKSPGYFHIELETLAWLYNWEKSSCLKNTTYLPYGEMYSVILIGWENLFTWFCVTSRQEEFFPPNLKQHLICLSFPSLAGKCDWIFNFPWAQLPEITCAAFQPWGCPSNPVPCSLRLQPSSGCVALWMGQAESIPGPCWPHPSPLWPQDSWVGPVWRCTRLDWTVSCSGFLLIMDWLWIMF